MVRKFICIICAAALSAAGLGAQVPDAPTCPIAPYWFGPYAFPVPDQLGGQVQGRLNVELCGDMAIGHLAGSGNKDCSFAPSFRLNVPLWTDRVNLSIWGELYEWYRDTPALRTKRGIDPSLTALKRGDAGNLYFSVDILVLRERKWTPSVAVRAATLSAAGDDFEYARHYDGAGYFFDVSAGKNFNVGTTSVIRPSLTLGFLCWQNGLAKQNDAFLCGVQLLYANKWTRLTAEYGFYKGWGRSAVPDPNINPGDFPKVVKARLDIFAGRFAPFVACAYGLDDWPYLQFKAGLAVKFDILSCGKK